MLRRTSLLLATLLLVLATSCSKKENALLNTVPESSAVVFTIDLEKFFDDAGWLDKDGNLHFPENLGPLRLGDTDEFEENYSKLRYAIDVNNIVAFGSNPKNIFATFTITEPTLLAKLLKDVETTESGDFTVYALSSISNLVVKGTQGWLAPVSDPTEAINQILADAKQANITSIKGAMDVLTDDEPICGIIKCPLFDAQWATFLASTSHDEVEIESQLIKSDGSVVKIAGLQPIDTDFLRYLPADFNIAFAAGLAKDFPWNKVLEEATNNAGYQTRGVIDIVSSFVKDQEGTISVAMKVDSDHPERQMPDMFAMVHLSQDKVNALTELIKSQFAMMGVPMIPDAQGIYHFNYGPMNINFGSVDGNFAIATIPLTPTRNNELTPVFNGKNAAGIATATLDGVNLRATLQVSDVKAKLEIKILK